MSELSGYIKTWTIRWLVCASQPDGTVWQQQKKIYRAAVLQIDLKLYQIFKEKFVYLKKLYKTILKNVKKGIENIRATLANT